MSLTYMYTSGAFHFSALSSTVELGCLHFKNFDGLNAGIATKMALSIRKVILRFATWSDLSQLHRGHCVTNYTGVGAAFAKCMIKRVSNNYR